MEKSLVFICEGNELSLYLTRQIMKEKTLVIRAKSHCLDSSFCCMHLLFLLLLTLLSPVNYCSSSCKIDLPQNTSWYYLYFLTTTFFKINI